MYKFHVASWREKNYLWHAMSRLKRNKFQNPFFGKFEFQFFFETPKNMAPKLAFKFAPFPAPGSAELKKYRKHISEKKARCMDITKADVRLTHPGRSAAQVFFVRLYNRLKAD
jgi:hypothetical protein